MSANKAQILAFIGASGSGKSQSIKQAIRKARPRRLLVWDRMREYEGHGEAFTRLSELHDAVMTEPNKPRATFKARFLPAGDRELVTRAFNGFCWLGYAIGNCALVVEELALVTTASYAPHWWREATLTGRHQGLTIMASSQRPASVDKDFFSNATLIRCGRLNYENDIRTMSNVLHVDRKEISNLPELHYIERDMRTGETRRGVVPLPK